MRKLGVALVVLMVMVLLAGCNTTDTSSPVVGGVKKTDDKVAASVCQSNMTTIARDYQRVKADAEGEDVPAPQNMEQWAQMMVPQYSPEVPTCPVGGKYSLASAGDSILVTCSIHGAGRP